MRFRVLLTETFFQLGMATALTTVGLFFYQLLARLAQWPPVGNFVLVSFGFLTAILLLGLVNVILFSVGKAENGEERLTASFVSVLIVVFALVAFVGPAGQEVQKGEEMAATATKCAYEVIMSKPTATFMSTPSPTPTSAPVPTNTSTPTSTPTNTPTPKPTATPIHGLLHCDPPKYPPIRTFQLSPLVPPPSPAPEARKIFYERTIPIDYVFTKNDYICLASSDDGTGQLQVDDRILVEVRDERGKVLAVWFFDFYDPKVLPSGGISPIEPRDASPLFARGGKVVYIELGDNFPFTYSATPIWVVIWTR